MIRIKNIYYMLSYAYRVLNEDSYHKIASEEFDNTADLFAAILSLGIANQLKRGLQRDYIVVDEDLNSPRGKINISESIKDNTLILRKLKCSYDSYGENIYMNQILKTTSYILLKSNDVKMAHKKGLKKSILFFNNVDLLNPRTIKWYKLKYTRNNQTYKMLMNIC